MNTNPQPEAKPNSPRHSTPACPAKRDASVPPCPPWSNPSFNPQPSTSSPPPLPTITIDDQTALWIPATNRYILVPPPADEIVRRIATGSSPDEVVAYCQDILGRPRDESIQMEQDIRTLLLSPSVPPTANQQQSPPAPATRHPSSPPTANRQSRTPTLKRSGRTPQGVGTNCQLPTANRQRPPSTKTYRVFGCTFRIDYDSAYTQNMVHPKFAHLEQDPALDAQHHFQLLQESRNFILYVDGERVGSWPPSQEHVCSGQCGMHMIHKIYQRSSADWMGVLHAAAVAQNEKCLIFAGDSGAGKSTLSALLAASGLTVLADDFLPLEGETGRACHFPAALSVKQQALEILAPRFPVLHQAQTHHAPQQGKIFRYLPISGHQSSPPPPCSCIGLIFVQYDPATDCQLLPMPASEAFQRLVPDAWLHPSAENAQNFLNWFAALPCYQLTYSNPTTMLTTIQNLLKNRD